MQACTVRRLLCQRVSTYQESAWLRITAFGVVCRPELQNASKATADPDVTDKWLLVFKPSAHIQKLQELCLEAEHSLQGRFNGTCGRLHSGSLLQAVSGKFVIIYILLLPVFRLLCFACHKS